MWFQSRNRETFDSNFYTQPGPLLVARFNLVIEKLLIPTRRLENKHRFQGIRFNLVIEKLLIPTQA